MLAITQNVCYNKYTQIVCKDGEAMNKELNEAVDVVIESVKLLCKVVAKLDAANDYATLQRKQFKIIPGGQVEGQKNAQQTKGQSKNG